MSFLDKVKKVAAYNSDSGDIKISNKGDLTVGSVGSTTGITNDASGGDVIVKVHSNLLLDAPTTTAGGDVTYTADENITHNVNGDVMTSGGDFTGNAGKDYTLKDGASILTGDGDIDIYAGNNISLGSGPAVLKTNFFLKELKNLESRGYILKDWGYYTKNTMISLKGREDGISVKLPSNAEGFYITMEEYSGGATRTYYTNPTLNPDGKEHLKVNSDGTVTFNWEDLYGLGDRDFNDVIFQYTNLSGTPVYLGSYLSSNNNIFLTANNGSISQQSGKIYANNLMLSANIGITGVNADDAVDTYVDNLSAVNNTGNIRIRNTKDLTIADLSGIDGLNPGVKGYNGISNGSGIVAITVVDDPNLIVKAPIKALGNMVSLNVVGALIDGHAGTDIYADSLELLTLDGIKGIPGWNSFLETQVSNLAAHNSTSGDINIDNTGDLTITTVGSTSGVVNNGSGIIDISTASPIYVNSDVISSGGNIYLTANNSDGFIEVNGQILSNGGNIYLTAYGKDATNNSITIGDDVDADTGNVIFYTFTGTSVPSFKQ